jgi:septal ring factor EnvC (AmiA/AmiB activator)
MKPDFDHITRKFLLGENYDPTVLSSIQMVFEMLNGIRITSQRDTNKIEVAKEQIVKVRRHVKRIEDKNRNLEEQIGVLEEKLNVLEEKKQCPACKGRKK